HAPPPSAIYTLSLHDALPISRIAKKPKQLEWVLRDLQDAGLGSLPGGGAEVFDDRVHDEVFKGKIRSEQWLEVHQVAHQIGLMTDRKSTRLNSSHSQISYAVF